MCRRFAVVFILFSLAGCLWPQERVAETKRRGETICAALRNYLERTGAYPAELRQLVPRDLPAIPLPTVGKKRWEYRTWADGGIRQFYRLQVSTSWLRGDADLWRDSKHEEWWYDTK